MTQVAEIVTFALAEDTDEQAFIGLSRASEAFVRAAPGFLHRQLSCGDDGRWTDYVIWADIDSARAAAARFPEQGFAPALMRAIDPASLSMRHEDIRWTMAA